MVSTVVETSTPERELEPGLKLLGPIFEKCVVQSLLSLSIPHADQWKTTQIRIDYSDLRTGFERDEG